MILVTGAAGKTGSAVVRALISREMPIRAFVRRQGQIAALSESGAQEILVGDMKDAAMFCQAAEGVRVLYHICPNMSPDEVEIGRNAIAAAKKANVDHFVYHSVLHPQIEAMPHHWLKMRVEEMLYTSGLAVTILQPAAYMQNILAGWTTIVERGIYRVPYPVETRLRMVDLLDVAESVAVVLTESSHKGATYELAGPQNLTQTEVATVLTQCLGRVVRAEQMPRSEWRERAEAVGLGAYQIDTLLKMFHYYEDFGFGGNSRVVGQLLGRPATDFATFVRRTVSVSLA